jgi:Zn-dependent M28 family amino/carboxypeptidase
LERNINASRVGEMLEVSEVLAKYKTRGTIKFIAFGAEEMGQVWHNG